MPEKEKKKAQDVKQFFPDEYIRRAVKVLKLISEESKLRIMLLLAKEGAYRATDIAEDLNMNQTTVSHHLSLLRNADLVVTNRNGKNIYYDVNDTFWRVMGREFFEHLQKGDDIHFLGKFILKRLTR